MAMLTTNFNHSGLLVDGQLGGGSWHVQISIFTLLHASVTDCGLLAELLLISVVHNDTIIITSGDNAIVANDFQAPNFTVPVTLGQHVDISLLALFNNATIPETNNAIALEEVHRDWVILG